MLAGEARRVRIYIGECHVWHHHSLHEAIVLLLKKEGCAGATVTKGVMGYGPRSHVHSANILRLSEDLPVVVEFVDTAERVERVLPLLADMVEDGLITVEPVTVVPTRTSGRSTSGRGSV